MDNPRLDSEDRKPIWDALQMFWMDIEPSDELENAIATCAYDLQVNRPLYKKTTLP